MTGEQTHEPPGKPTLVSTCFLCCKPNFVPKRPRKVVQDVLASLQKDEWLGPIFLPNDVHSKRVHQSCGLWCPEVYYDHEKERLRKLPDAIQRSKKIPCHKCKQKGAAIGCVVPECPRSYHLICAHDDKCAFNTSTYSLACPMHIKRLTSKNAIEWTNFALEELLHPKEEEEDELEAALRDIGIEAPNARVPDDEEEKELLLLLHETSRIFRHSRSRRESLRTVTRGVRELERFV